MITAVGGTVSVTDHRMHPDEAAATLQSHIKKDARAQSTRKTHRIDYLKDPVGTIKKFCDFQDKYIDPYVKVAVMPWQIFGQTHHIEDAADGASLEWNETLELVYPEDELHAHDLRIVVQAWDDDVGVDDLIGQGRIDDEDLNKVVANPGVMQPVKCELVDHTNEGAGVVFMEVTFVAEKKPSRAPATGSGHHIKWHADDGATQGKFLIKVCKAKELRNPSKEITSANEDKKLLFKAGGIAFLYFAMGAIIFNRGCKTSDHGIEHHWTFIDTIYFAIVTITTTGYGDLLPNHKYCSNGIQAYVCFHAFIGVGMIASLMGFIVGTMLEKRTKQTLFIDLTKETVDVDKKKTIQDGEEAKLSHWNPIVKYVPFKYQPTVWAFLWWAGLKIIVIVFFCMADPIPHSADDSDFWAADVVGDGGDDDSWNHCNVGATFDAEVHDQSATLSHIRECSTYCSEADNKKCADGSCDECIGNFKHSYLRPIDVVYMVSVSMTSVGYGDYSPTTQTARGFTIVWLLLGTLLVGRAFGELASHFLASRQASLNKKNIEKQYDLSKVMKMDEGGDGEVTEIEFIATMLVKGNVCKQIELDDLRARFKELDKSGDGFIGEEDLVSEGEEDEGETAGAGDGPKRDSLTANPTEA